MSHVGSLSLDEAPRLPSRTRQFLAIMLKNVLLQIRSKKVCGIRCSGFFAVVMDMLVPVAFIAVMCLVRELKDVDTKPRLFKEIPLRSTDWEFPHIGAFTVGLTDYYHVVGSPMNPRPRGHARPCPRIAPCITIEVFFRRTSRCWWRYGTHVSSSDCLFTRTDPTSCHLSRTSTSRHRLLEIWKLFEGTHVLGDAFECKTVQLYPTRLCAQHCEPSFPLSNLHIHCKHSIVCACVIDCSLMFVNAVWCRTLNKHNPQHQQCPAYCRSE